MLVKVSLKFDKEVECGKKVPCFELFDFYVDCENLNNTGVGVSDALCAFNSNVDCHFLDSGKYKVNGHVLRTLLRSVVKVYVSAFLNKEIVKGYGVSRPSSVG